MYDPETADSYFNEDSFGEKNVRLGFIRKVYSILFVQIGITGGMISLFLYVDAIRDYSSDNPWMWILSFVLTIIILIVLACCPDFRRRSPLNFVLLIAFTVCEGFLLGTVASQNKTDEVLMAVGITAVVTLALTIFAFQTKWDFTMMGGMLFVLVIVLFCFGILAAIIQSRILSLVYASIGALIFSAYIVFDTQLMLGGKHKYALSPEEYIFAALNLYLDIINLFLFILSIIGATRD
ncbi:protein lifeguard 1 [Aplysia californica]|uniref:Protein lifeguard 1 n=1 Tax=Aplysia californica TaxID=6500 RepID=A0ABM1VQZ5_APLCA|nr:protein lifeguard 1 [Aplysia californica]